MLSISVWVFWLSLGFIGWTYVGYPLVIMLLARLRPKHSANGTHNPSLSIIMAVHNEAGSLKQKIENLQSLEYPKDKYEIIIISDGSTDQTCKVLNTIIERSEPTNAPLSMLVLEQQKGKPHALNRGVEQATGEMILFCDARQRIAPDALHQLTHHFSDPKIGAVSGELVIDSKQGPGMYWKYERAIRKAEGRFDSTVGATGAMYMLRRSLYQAIPDKSLLDDMLIPLQVSLQGYRVIFESEAKVYDKEAKLNREFQRKARTLAGNFQLIELMPALLNPFRNRLFVQFIFHKMMRLFCPYALLLLLLSSPVLAFCSFSISWFYQLSLMAQILCYGAALPAGDNVLKKYRFAKLCRTFLILNLAAIVGFFRYLKRDFAWTR